MEFGTRQTEFSIGTSESPLPIRMRILPIYAALNNSEYWMGLENGDTYSSLGIATKRDHLVTAFGDYKRVMGRLASGIVI